MLILSIFTHLVALECLGPQICISRSDGLSFLFSDIVALPIPLRFDLSAGIRSPFLLMFAARLAIAVVAAPLSSTGHSRYIRPTGHSRSDS